jgi:hypothetical protein
VAIVAPVLFSETQYALQSMHAEILKQLCLSVSGKIST